jgi:hypothetical protein
MLELQIIIASIMRRYDIVLEDPDFIVSRPLLGYNFNADVLSAGHSGRVFAQAFRMPNWDQASGSSPVGLA